MGSQGSDLQEGQRRHHPEEENPVEGFLLCLEKIPTYVANRQGEEIKSTLTLQTYMMRSNMEYLSGDRDSAAFAKARQFFQDVADIGVGARDKRWPLAQESYNKAAATLSAWKGMVGY